VNVTSPQGVVGLQSARPHTSFGPVQSADVLHVPSYPPAGAVQVPMPLAQVPSAIHFA